MHVQINDIHMYTHVLTKYRTRKSFMMNSFLFNTQNDSFHDRVISIVQ